MFRGLLSCQSTNNFTAKSARSITRRGASSPITANPTSNPPPAATPIQSPISPTNTTAAPGPRLHPRLPLRLPLRRISYFQRINQPIEFRRQYQYTGVRVGLRLRDQVRAREDNCGIQQYSSFCNHSDDGPIMAVQPSEQPQLAQGVVLKLAHSDKETERILNYMSDPVNCPTTRRLISRSDAGECPARLADQARLHRRGTSQFQLRHFQKRD